MRKIKVAFFADILVEDFDGAVRTIFQLIKRIDTTKFEYLFIYGAGPDKLMGFESFKIPAIPLPINTNYSIALPMLAKKRLHNKLQAFGADVIHISTPSFLGNFGLDYANRTGLPVISIYHTHFISYIDYYFKYAPIFIKGLKQRIAKGHKSFYNRCDKVYVPSETIKTELREMGVYTSKMKIWKRGIDAYLFSPDKKDKSIIRRLTGNNNPTIIFASRLVWEKNLETLFAIYDKMQAGAKQVNFLIVGDGTAWLACEARMPKAIFTGKISHQKLAGLYASADVFLFPSVSEAYGNVVIEAMASGLPCVIADGGGSGDFIEQGINGFKCSPYNADDYVEKIELLLANKALSIQFAAEGLQSSRKLSWEILAQVYFNDVRSLAIPPAGQPAPVSKPALAI
ncbi:glycosyltransferase family 1 protein [Mucilaginibacter rigui]|uniref:Glycosyltransferase family 1 protein n=1 Tax=Mucilaginibacter rigui TaxID=534635 RepID=A0ABR7X3N1_9SPHI|nr:glycosyltransferase family 1 protein [Mucilaginibacter rigui]MBD1384392.1 glycosyltransferase family 1 protein [Mucilaginibacter rigui]